MKKNKVEINDSPQYREWLDTACDKGRTDVALMLKMENPAKLAKRAEMEDLLAAQALRDQTVKDAAAAKRKNCDSDSDIDGSEELEPEEWDYLNVHMNKLYDKYAIDSRYDLHTPVFIDPGNPNRYMLLTADACSTWAHNLVSFFWFGLYNLVGVVLIDSYSRLSESPACQCRLPLARCHLLQLLGPNGLVSTNPKAVGARPR